MSEGRLRWLTATLQPWVRKERVIARPMPVVPPVIWRGVSEMGVVCMGKEGEEKRVIIMGEIGICGFRL